MTGTAKGTTPDHYEETYTDPALRRELKDKIRRGDKGARPGLWSARKSQLLSREYIAHGGGFLNAEDHKTPAQKSLDQWTQQH